jgi:hypothetical protein
VLGRRGELYPVETDVRLCEELSTGDEVEVDMVENVLTNLSTGKKYKLLGLGDVSYGLSAGGGLGLGLGPGPAAAAAGPAAGGEERRGQSAGSWAGREPVGSAVVACGCRVCVAGAGGACASAWPHAWNGGRQEACWRILAVSKKGSGLLSRSGLSVGRPLFGGWLSSSPGCCCFCRPAQ